MDSTRLFAIAAATALATACGGSSTDNSTVVPQNEAGPDVTVKPDSGADTAQHPPDSAPDVEASALPDSQVVCKPACSGTTPVCDSISGTCLCNSTSCGTGSSCQSGVCETGDPCDLYVAVGGKDSNPGTSEAPLQTLQAGVKLLKAGETLCVKPGVYQEGVVIGTAGLSSSKPTTIKSTSPGAVIEPKSKIGVDITANFVKLEGLEIRGGDPNNVRVTGHDAYLKSLTVHNSHRAGVRVVNAQRAHINGGKYYDNGTDGWVEANKSHSVGIQFNEIVDDAVVENAEFYSSDLEPEQKIQSSSVSFWDTYQTHNITIKNLNVHSHPDQGLSITPGPKHTGTNDIGDAELFNVTVSQCEFWHNGRILQVNGQGSYYRANLLIQNAENVLVERNKFYDSWGWGLDCYVCNKLHVVNNLFLNMHKKPSTPYGPGVGVEVNAGRENYVLFNTFVSNDFGLLATYGFLGPGPDAGPPLGVVYWHNNLFYNNDTDYSRPQHKEGTALGPQHPDDHKFNFLKENGNPQFVNFANNDLHLQSDSPAIDKAEQMPAVKVANDYDGTSRPQGDAPDIGAYEYVKK